ncbi:MAG: hypothetical protein RLZZ44_1302, partial [Bacteroidota bacterium]
HSFGRNAKSVLELSRKSIAKQLNAAGSEIFFTSSGTEANNWILRSAVRDLGVQRIITTAVEHHAVLYPVLALQKEFGIQVDFVAILADGSIDMTHLVELLSQNIPTLVSLMHVNNEVGVVLDIARVAVICKEHQALFHSDTVQSIGKTEIDLKSLPVDFISASAHKFHGPKGIGFAFIRKNLGVQPLLLGGEQEKGMRGGTESIYQVAGMAKALEMAYANLEKERAYITDLKTYCCSRLTQVFPSSKIIASKNGFYTIINVILPITADKTGMLLFHLDIKGIAVSRGSACQSGSSTPSHVLAEMLSPDELTHPSLRISLSHYNTKEDIDYLIEVLQSA